MFNNYGKQIPAVIGHKYMENMTEARIYVVTYGNYTAGSIFGDWLYLSDYSDKDEFDEACLELHKDEKDAEFMYQYWENIPESLIGESWLSEKFFELRDSVEDMDDTRQEAFFVYCENILSQRELIVDTPQNQSNE